MLHVDLDQFLAAVEVLRHPELAGLPVVVGGRGDPTERGVVSTASYEARAFGVGSGMPLRVAARKCPDAVFLPVDREVYDAASGEVMATLRSLTWGGVPVVLEVLGWDEAFLAAGPDHGELGDPREYAAQIHDAVLDDDRSALLGRHRRQQAARQDRDGLRQAPRGVAADGGQLAGGDGRPADDRPVGDRRQDAASDWPRSASTRSTSSPDSDVRVLAAEVGPSTGPWLHRLGRGEDSSPVDATPWVPRAHGREETFQTDLEDWGEVADAVRRITRRAVDDIDREGRPAARVGLKIRLKPFITLSRSLTLPEPTNDPEALAEAAVSLLERVEHDRAVRLLGVRLEMVPPEGGY